MKKNNFFDNNQSVAILQHGEAKPLTTARLAFENIRRKPFRSASLSAVAALVAFTLFACGILSFSMRNGLGSLEARLGADLIVVPVGYDKGIEGLLLKGEPAYFYFDKSVEEKIKGVEGVKEVSAQFFLTSLNQDCCAVPVQFIGFDPATDFSIQPWIAKSYSKSVGDGELVVGCDIASSGDRQLKFFNENYSVAARLEKTGTGLDQAVYANMNTLRRLLEGAKRQGLTFIKEIDADSSISSVLVKLEAGYTVEEVTHNIRASFDGLQVIQSKSMIGTIAGGLKAFSAFASVLAFFFFVSALLMFALAFSLLANERKREFAVCRALGASSKKLSAIVLSEAFFVCAFGGAVGTLVSAIVVLPFAALVGRSLRLPCLLPGAPLVIALAFASLALSSAIGPLAAVWEVSKLAGREVFLEIKEGE
ncbi:MAG: ABC transporter permease [Treponema sp.]|nr:ABC transporter permease [Treponema sp.]